MNAVKTDRYDEKAYQTALAVHENLRLLADQGEIQVGGWGGQLNAVFQEFFQATPELHEKTHDNSLFHEMTTQIQEMQEYHDLRHYTIGDVSSSAVATDAIGGKILPLMSDRLKSSLRAQEERARRMEQLMADALLCARKIGQTPTTEWEDALTEVSQQIGELDGALVVGDFDDEMDVIRQAVRKAAAEACKTLTFVSEAGTQYGVGGTSMPLAAKQDLMTRLQKSKKLQDLFAMSGRFKDIMMQKRRKQVPMRRQEITGLRMGDDLTAALPTELAFIKHPVLSRLFLKNLADRALTLFEYKGEAELGGGPIIMLVDGSGSMHGSRELWSKGIMLALLQKAKLDRRDMYVMQFSHRQTDARTWKFPYRTEPALVDWGLLLDACEAFINGGTDFMYPLSWAMDQISRPRQPWDRADILLITDGEAHITPGWKEEFMRKRDECGVHTFGLVLGAVSSSLTEVLESITFLPDLLDDEAALDMVFGHGGH